MDTDRQVRPAETPPVEEGLLFEPKPDALEGLGHRRHNPCIPSSSLVLGQRLEHDELRPRIVLAVALAAPDRTEPPIGRLVSEDVVNPRLRLGFQKRVIQQIRQRHDAIKPIRSSLPSLGPTSNPGTIRDVRPELVQVAAQTVCLDAQLVT